eukprot:gb/GECH01013709.1/.p1 GENE.gb/GECH01013709.1/~~gb/GECH01013709.1/.p1  ORF type:complete len:381 (+),score=39.56 gb/GECH01013709.1/:1-1143(+)
MKPTWVVPILSSVLISFITGLLLWLIVRHFISKTTTQADDHIAKAARMPSFIFIVLLSLMFILPATNTTQPHLDRMRQALAVFIILCFAWLAIAIINSVTSPKVSQDLYSTQKARKGRQLRTQIYIVKRVGIAVVITIACGAIIFTFQQLRELGESLLVSAGLLGVAVGLAAKPVLENVLASIQIAFTKPLCINDIVVMRGEWGRVEAIDSTYVTLLVWDGRRIVIPLLEVITRSFENWTHAHDNHILALAFIYVDYTVPMDKIREKLRKVVSKTPLWDGRQCSVRLTDARPHCVEIRCGATARNGVDAWQLRSYIREHMIQFLQRKYPRCLPYHRSEMRRAKYHVPFVARSNTESQSDPSLSGSYGSSDSLSSSTPRST